MGFYAERREQHEAAQLFSMNTLVLSALKQVLCFLSVLICAANHVHMYCVYVYLCLLGTHSELYS